MPSAPAGPLHCDPALRLRQGFSNVGGVHTISYPRGVQRFIVNRHGVLFQKDLGADTATAIEAVQSLDPDSSWTTITPPAEQARTADASWFSRKPRPGHRRGLSPSGLAGMEVNQGRGFPIRWRLAQSPAPLRPRQANCMSRQRPLGEEAQPADAPPGFHLLAKPSGSACNIECTHGSFLSKEALYPNEKSRMSQATLEAYLRQPLESHRAPQVTVAWQGGEPTLMKLEFFERSIELVGQYRKPGQQVLHTFQTNGMRLDDDWCAFFKKNGFLVGLSVDGPREIRARRATEGRASGAPRADPEVVAVARRRQFSAGQKRALVAEADRCQGSGELGALAPERRRPKQDLAARQIQQLNRDSGRLRHRLERAELIIDARNGMGHLMRICATPAGTLTGASRSHLRREVVRTGESVEPRDPDGPGAMRP